MKFFDIQKVAHLQVINAEHQVSILKKKTTTIRRLFFTKCMVFPDLQQIGPEEIMGVAVITMNILSKK